MSLSYVACRGHRGSRYTSTRLFHFFVHRRVDETHSSLYKLPSRTLLAWAAHLSVYTELFLGKGGGLVCLLGEYPLNYISCTYFGGFLLFPMFLVAFVALHHGGTDVYKGIPLHQPHSPHGENGFPSDHGSELLRRKMTNHT